MREQVSTNLEWIGRSVHSYVEEVRTSAISNLVSCPEEKRDEMCAVICDSIRGQIAEVDKFPGRVGDKVYEDILDFEERSENLLDEKYLRPITDLCADYNKSIMSYLSQFSEREKLETLPSLTAGVLVLLADIRCKIQALQM